MDSALALLLPLVGGSLFVRHANFLKYRIAREDGHKLYFRIAYHGFLLFFSSWGICLAVELALGGHPWLSTVRSHWVRTLAPLLKSPERAEAQLGLLLICSLTVPLGRWSPWLFNRFKATSERAMWEAAEEDELEELLLDALLQAQAISITLTSDKVYAGFVLSTPEPRTQRKVLALLPLMSGYRGDGGKVHFTTFYDQIYSERVDADGGEFRLVLPVDKMMSIAFFDVAVYARFQEKARVDAPPVSWTVPQVAEGEDG